MSDSGCTSVTQSLLCSTELWSLNESDQGAYLRGAELTRECRHGRTGLAARNGIDESTVSLSGQSRRIQGGDLNRGVALTVSAMTPGAIGRVEGGGVNSRGGGSRSGRFGWGGSRRGRRCR